jgi:DHA3 family macrolide efflux protein-like MFS transporter
MKTEHTNRPRPNWATPFFTIWTGQAFSLIGSSVAGFALVWWLTDLTGSATVLASATLVSLLPSVFLGPFTGALVDRWNRRIVMIVADSVIALFSAWLAYLFWIDAMQIWHVYVVMFVRALGGAFHWPSMQASTSLMVPKEHLSRVAGINQTMQGVLNIISPPLGAFLMSVLPLYAIMGIDVATAAFAVTPLFVIAIPQPERPSAAARTAAARASLWQDVKEGVSYLARWPGALAMLIMATVVNMMANPAFSLMPLLIKNHFGGGALQLGWMNSSWGIGVVLGGLTLSVWGGFRRRILTSLAGLVGMGIGTLLIGLTPAAVFGMALGAIFVAGFMNPITNGPVFAILQATVAPEMQGRVFMLVGSLAAAASPLGMAIAGPVADALGVRAWFIFAGVTCCLMGVSAFFVPAILHLEDQKPTLAVEAEPAPAAATGARVPAWEPARPSMETDADV